MKSLFKKLQKHKKKLFIFTGIVLAILLFYILKPSGTETVSAQFAVVETIERGAVSSGIETTGTIIAADKLSLDVYKQSKRIEVVNVANGGHVEAGSVLFSFDKSSANVATQSAATRVAEAKLNLSAEQDNYNDSNTEIKSLDQQIKDLEISINQAEQDKIDAYQDYLNQNLEAEPEGSRTEDKNKPIISGYYNGEETGEYKVEVYSSAAESGYSYRVTGLSSYTGTMYSNNSSDLGNDGLKIKFPNDVKSGDEWVIAIPNTYSSNSTKNLNDYNQSIIDLDKKITSYKSDIEIKQQNLGDASYLDTKDYRDLALSKAEAELSEARVTLSEYYEVVQDQNIIAPFSGTIDGLENVVVGATPSGGSEDPISFGTLISDEFLASFSLGAVDVSKVEIGQKVLVTVTSFTSAEPLEAYITEISSLPDSSDVAQYSVQALIEPIEDMSFQLREGLLADIEIIEEEAVDVLRIPRSAISYTNRTPSVNVLSELSEDQQSQVQRLGIIRSDDGTFPSYPVQIRIGLEGAYYVEITEGLEEGQQIIASKSEGEEESVVQSSVRGGGGGGAVPGSGGGGNRPTN